MKLLILTQYFPPETGAPQNRLFELALRLQKQGVHVDVLTAMPNYPRYEIFPEYKGKKFVKENMQGMDVFRTWIYTKKTTSIVLRLLNYFSFVFSSLWFSGRIKGKYDFLMVESPPLFLGTSAWWIARRKKAALITNISDLWPESAEKLGIIENKLFLGMAYKLEAWLYRKSVLVTGQTLGIVNDIKSRFPSKKVYWLKNGVDLSYYQPENYSGETWRNQHNIGKDTTVLLYAGILGHAQGLEIILKAAEKVKHEPNILFAIVGDGPEKEKLERLIAGMSLTNVRMFPSVSKAEMPYLVKAADAAVVPLKKLDLFKGAIPSKIFENLAMEKPVLLGVDGEARELFIKNAGAGIYFEPENFEELAQAALEVHKDETRLKSLGVKGREFVTNHFNRDKIAAEFIATLREVKENS